MGRDLTSPDQSKFLSRLTTANKDGGSDDINGSNWNIKRGSKRLEQGRGQHCSAGAPEMK